MNTASLVGDTGLLGGDIRRAERLNTHRTGKTDAMTSLASLATGSHKVHRAGAAAFAMICLATGCASTPLIDDSSSVAAAAVARPSDSTIAGDSTAPTTTSAPSTLPALHELLAQERFVPTADALERSGLDVVIDGLDDFVLLAPTGTAFRSTGADVGIESSTLMSNPPLLEAIMRYHVVANPSTNETWRTLNGAELDVSGSDPGTVERVDGVEVLYQIPVRNGIVLVMPRLLVPTTPQLGAVVLDR